MRRLVSILSVLAFLLVLGAPALAQATSSGSSAGSAAGDWDVVLNTPAGPRNFKATFKIDGEKLTGALKGERGDLPIEGTAKGKEIKFSYTVKYMDNDLVITMTGNVDGDAMKGTADFGGFAQDEWNAKRSTGAAAASARRSGPGRHHCAGGGEGGGRCQGLSR